MYGWEPPNSHPTLVAKVGMRKSSKKNICKLFEEVNKKKRRKSKKKKPKPEVRARKSCVCLNITYLPECRCACKLCESVYVSMSASVSE